MLLQPTLNSLLLFIDLLYFCHNTFEKTLSKNDPKNRQLRRPFQRTDNLHVDWLELYYVASGRGVQEQWPSPSPRRFFYIIYSNERIICQLPVEQSKIQNEYKLSLE